MIFVKRRVETAQDAIAYTSAQSGVTYTNGIENLSDEALRKIAMAISDNNQISSSTSDVWISPYNRHISIGDQIDIPMNGVNYPYRIMGFNHYSLASSTEYGRTTKTGKAGILFQMVNAFSEKQKINSTESSGLGWSNSELRTWLNTTMFGFFPSSTKAFIVPVSVNTATSVSDATIKTTTEFVLLPAEVEIYGSTEYAIGGTNEGNWYPWYKANNSDEKRVKYIGEDVSMWWQRSPASWNPSGSLRGALFGCVGSAGRRNSVWARYSRGISPCFCY